MKNLYGTFILFFFLNNQVLAQTVFHSVYKDLNSNIKLTNNSITSDLNNFYISGETSELPAKVFYLSLDSMGQIIYSKKIDSNDFFAHSTSIQKQGSSIFLLGYIQIPVEFHPFTFISKINSNGTLNWFKYFSPFIDNIPTSFSVLQNESIMIGGYLKEGSSLLNRIFLLKLNSSGNFTWAKRIEIGTESAPYALQQTLDGGYILTGYMKQIVNEPSKLVIAKFDSSGVFEFGKTYSNSNAIIGRSISEFVNGGYIITAEMNTTNQDKEILLIRTDLLGNIVWSKYVQGINNKSDSPSSSFIDENENIILAGTTGDFSSSNSNSAFLMKTNIDGNLDWFVSYFDSTSSDGIFETSGHQFVNTNQDGFAIVGSRRITNSSNPLENLFFVKTDSLGAADCYYSNVNINLTDITLNVSNIAPIESILTGDMINSVVPIVDYNLLQEYPCIIPVELTSFEVHIEQNGILLHWVTASELNNQGFEIEKTMENESSGWKTIGYVPGAGTTTEYNEYNFYDENINYCRTYYRLKQLDYDGTFNYSETIEIEIFLPSEFTLAQNYPNPFNPSTIISYQLPKAGNVTLKIFDVLGREIATLVEEYKNAGNYEVEFNASNITSGVYYYQFIVAEFIDAKKMILIK